MSVGWLVAWLEGLVRKARQQLTNKWAGRLVVEHIGEMFSCVRLVAMLCVRTSVYQAAKPKQPRQTQLRWGPEQPQKTSQKKDRSNHGRLRPAGAKAGTEATTTNSALVGTGATTAYQLKEGPEQPRQTRTGRRRGWDRSNHGRPTMSGAEAAKQTEPSNRSNRSRPRAHSCKPERRPRWPFPGFHA